MRRLEPLRLAAGDRMGLGDVSGSVVPKPVIVSPGDDVEASTPAAFGALVKSELVKWKAVVHKAKLTAD